MKQRKVPYHSHLSISSVFVYVILPGCEICRVSSTFTDLAYVLFSPHVARFESSSLTLVVDYHITQIIIRITHTVALPQHTRDLTPTSILASVGYVVLSPLDFCPA